MPLDAGALVRSFATGTYLVTRRTASTWVNGRAVPGPISTLSILAVVQPASGQDLLRLPEERRTTETRVLYTDARLYVGTPGGFEADRIEIDGAMWEVQHLEVWNPPGGIGVGGIGGVSSFYCRCMIQVVKAAS